MSKSDSKVLRQLEKNFEEFQELREELKSAKAVVDPDIRRSFHEFIDKYQKLISTLEDKINADDVKTGNKIMEEFVRDFEDALYTIGKLDEQLMEVGDQGARDMREDLVFSDNYDNFADFEDDFDKAMQVFYEIVGDINDMYGNVIG